MTKFLCHCCLYAFGCSLCIIQVLCFWCDHVMRLRLKQGQTTCGRFQGSCERIAESGCPKGRNVA